MKKLIPFIFLLAACNQKTYRVTGLIPDSDEAISKVPVYSVEMKIEAVLPSASRINMPIFDQGGEGSCASAAVAGVRSAEQYYRTGATSYSGANIFSIEFLYNQAKPLGGCSSGSSLITNLDLLKTKGVCLDALMPYSSTNGCDLQPNAEQLADAAKYKAGYSQVFLFDSVTVKTLLSNNHPLAIQVSIDDNFYNAKPGYIWNSFGTFVNNHGITLCGYDDIKRAWLVTNSFGTSWGDSGYLWVDYQFFKTVAYVGYVLNFDAPCPPAGTLLRTLCTGFDKYGVYTNGSCGETITLIQSNSPECGYVPPSDTIKPIVSINLPEGYQLSRRGSVTVTGSATDNVGVTGMKIFIDGVQKSACNCSPCSYSWSVKWLSSGNHVIKVTAADAKGNMGEKSITVKK